MGGNQFLIKIKITIAIIYSQKDVSINSLKNNDKNMFDSIIMLRSGVTKVAKEKIYAAKKPMDIWDINIDNIAISK